MWGGGVLKVVLNNMNHENDHGALSFEKYKYINHCYFHLASRGRLRL